MKCHMTFGINAVCIFKVQCGEFTAQSKWPPTIYLLVCTILNSVGYWSWSDGQTYFTNHVWSHLIIWVSKSCICTGNILLRPEFIHTRSDISRSLRHWQRNDRPSIRRCLPWRHHKVTWVTWSPLWHSLIHRILLSLLPQNNTFFIATSNVDKDAADYADCQGLREQWYYLRFYGSAEGPREVFKNSLCIS